MNLGQLLEHVKNAPSDAVPLLRGAAVDHAFPIDDVRLLPAAGAEPEAVVIDSHSPAVGITSLSCQDIETFLEELRDVTGHEKANFDLPVLLHGNLDSGPLESIEAEFGPKTDNRMYLITSAVLHSAKAIAAVAESKNVVDALAATVAAEENGKTASSPAPVEKLDISPSAQGVLELMRNQELILRVGTGRDTDAHLVIPGKTSGQPVNSEQVAELLSSGHLAKLDDAGKSSKAADCYTLPA